MVMLDPFTDAHAAICRAFPPSILAAPLAFDKLLGDPTKMINRANLVGTVSPNSLTHTKTWVQVHFPKVKLADWTWRGHAFQLGILYCELMKLWRKHIIFE